MSALARILLSIGFCFSIGAARNLNSSAISPQSAVAPPCQDDAAILAVFGAEQVEEGGSIAAWPGESYIIHWRLRNRGTCTWDSAYAIRLMQSPPGMEIEPERLILSRQVPPDGTLDFRATITAPSKPGEYSLFWALVNGAGEVVGEEMRLAVQVLSRSSGTPLPSPTPVPNILFWASPLEIMPYERVAFTWKVERAQAVYFSQAAEPWQPQRVPLQGSRYEYPKKSGAFVLRVVNNNGVMESHKIDIEVDPALGTPKILSFNFSPSGRIPLGSCVTIDWEIKGRQLLDVTLQGDGILLYTDQETAGSTIDCPVKTGRRVYLLTATGVGGTDTRRKTVCVIP